MSLISEGIKLLKKIDLYYNDMVVSGEDMPNGRLGMHIRCIMSYVFWGTSFAEYFDYKFWKRSMYEKKKYMTRRHMFSFFDQCNDPAFRERLGDKTLAIEYYGQFMKREQFTFDQGKESFIAFCSNHPRIFIKRISGWGGVDARIEDVSNVKEIDNVWSGLSEEFVVEPIIENCEIIKRLYPSSVNTVRITTLLIDGLPEIQYAWFRMGNGSVVDNLHYGGIAVGVDICTGQIITKGVDRHFQRFIKHPVTQYEFVGMFIPFWDEVIQLAKQAALITPELQYVSWDIAVTEEGPVLIEGNWDAEFVEQFIFEEGVRKKYIDRLERNNRNG